MLRLRPPPRLSFSLFHFQFVVSLSRPDKRRSQCPSLTADGVISSFLSLFVIYVSLNQEHVFARYIY